MKNHTTLPRPAEVLKRSVSAGILEKLSTGTARVAVVGLGYVGLPLAVEFAGSFPTVGIDIDARRVNGLVPEDTTLERTIARRPKGRVYLDYVQVGKGKTYVAPFSVRARDGAPVSMPLGWHEVEAMRRKRAPDTASEMTRWTIANVPKIIKKSGDPWSAEGWRPQRLEKALSNARSLWE